MKLNKKEVHITSSMLMSMLLALGCSQSHAGTMGPVVSPSGKAYVGVFGGGGGSQSISARQFGTAFFTEAEGGPLAVNAFGTIHSSSAGLVGGQLGYQWSEIPLTLFSSMTLAPAAELEGYYIGKTTFTGHEINNDTTRLPEHDFLSSYPLQTGAFLVNAVANLNLASQPKWHPYVGAGIGAGILSISNATALQTSPPEEGVNHYNSDTSSSDSAFAAQVKVGLNYQFTDNISVFGEYRWLYVSNTDYLFGSTVYSAHAATSSWAVKLGSQNYNLGAVGLRYSV